MKKVEIFDPAMCCDTGVCGPVVDPKLTELATSIQTLIQKGFPITRYNLANNPAAFVENQLVNKVLHEKGPEALPIVIVDQKIEKIGEYPTAEDFSTWYEIDKSELKIKEPKSKLNITLQPKEN
ncbi:arsenite efflux transporter metallochaperone ArsD [Alkalihalobacillus pseudalcaliphilus]|uniref:arsenite efflux transporter metallochaperone ArsD n=1 Tax=Alkalihalobacillus pseudalcaliphilus TaxID=79884 RepID=UPI00064E00CB|nr:arsenite efflux transporter metallochaperone ArsD [Alkalihalobacillus pseudalcaliphilus]KMK76293.1 arsenic resistance operon repressor [Alkalihalobacillus pseudalcaliphilus]